jgi:MFS family permease
VTSELRQLLVRPEPRATNGKIGKSNWFLSRLLSLSSLATELHSSLTVIQWVTSGYLLALVLMLPLNGWLVERIGAKRLYLVCFSGFTLASALCALSWSAGSLIGFRLLQGVRGGLMAPMTQLMLVRVAGKHLVRVVGHAAAPILLGPILGPVIAGAILQHATWHWLFLINLPIGCPAVVLAFLFLPDDDDTRGSERPRRDRLASALTRLGAVSVWIGSFGGADRGHGNPVVDYSAGGL